MLKLNGYNRSEPDGNHRGHHGGHPDRMDVFLSCELELCKGGWDTHCEMDDYPIDIILALGRIIQPNDRRFPPPSAWHSFHHDPGDGRRGRNGVKKPNRSTRTGRSIDEEPRNTSGHAKLARHIPVISADDPPDFDGGSLDFQQYKAKHEGEICLSPVSFASELTSLLATIFVTVFLLMEIVIFHCFFIVFLQTIHGGGGSLNDDCFNTDENHNDDGSPNRYVCQYCRQNYYPEENCPLCGKEMPETWEDTEA